MFADRSERDAARCLSTHSGEFDWIDRLATRERAANVAPADGLGIGDDAAFVPTSSAGVLVATDTLLHGVHFDDGASPEQIGHKAIAVNLSDIAAMAGVPKAATVALTAPRSVSTDWLDRLMAGLQDTAHRFGAAVVGGDTTSWDGPLAVTVTVLGEPGPAGVVTRGGGRAGDVLYVTGPLGGSLKGHHLTFEPRVSEALALVDAVSVTAMIDLSDGLASDIRHLCTASACGAAIDGDALPLREGLAGDAIDHALTDGEDFELLVAVSEESASNVPASLTRVGRLTSSHEILLTRGGETTPLCRTGYSHSIANATDD